MDRKLTITILGNVAILVDDQPVKKFRSRKAIALLTYLACTKRGHNREQLADLLWDTTSTKQSLSNLRTILAMIRLQLEPFILSENAQLSLDFSQTINIDYLLLKEKIRNLPEVLDKDTAQELNQILLLYEGEFLSGFEFPNAPRFTEWVRIRRRCTHNHILCAYQKLAVFYLGNQMVAEGVEVAQRWLEIDSVNEAAHEVLMKLYAQGGHRNAALNHFEDCCLLLGEELGLNPGASLQAVYEQIRDGAT